MTVAAAAAGPGPAIVAFELTAVPSGPTEVRRLAVRNKCKYASLSPASRSRWPGTHWQAGKQTRARRPVTRPLPRPGRAASEDLRRASGAAWSLRGVLRRPRRPAQIRPP